VYTSERILADSATHFRSDLDVALSPKLGVAQEAKQDLRMTHLHCHSSYFLFAVNTSMQAFVLDLTQG